MSDYSAAVLEDFVRNFDSEITSALRFFDDACPQFAYNWLTDNNRVAIRPVSQDGAPAMVTLKSRGSAILGLVPVFNCSWDSSQQFLATEVSSFSVHPFGNARSEPLFRVEYVRSQNQDLPSSHVHVHAHRDEFTHLLGFAAKLDAENSRQVKRYLSGTTTLSQFHFPTGGHRFRPCLEDLLEVLRVEFALDVQTGPWRDHLRKARLRWRGIQTAAAVRDHPEAALRVLVEELGMPTPDGWECPALNQTKIVRS